MLADFNGASGGNEDVTQGERIMERNPEGQKGEQDEKDQDEAPPQPYIRGIQVGPATSTLECVDCVCLIRLDSIVQDHALIGNLKVSIGNHDDTSPWHFLTFHVLARLLLSSLSMEAWSNGVCRTLIRPRSLRGRPIDTDDKQRHWSLIAFDITESSTATREDIGPSPLDSSLGPSSNICLSPTCWPPSS